MRIVTNIDDEIIFKSSSDTQFIEFVKLIVIDNEDFDTSILGISDALEYLEEYNPDLNLTV